MVEKKDLEDKEDLPNSNEDVEKIIVLGLANSGKTSIILSLKGVTNLLSYLTLKPTKGIEINDIDEGDNKFFIWDFGGQDLFRIRHLKDFKRNAAGSSKLIYVIDCQDVEKFSAAIAFLKDLLNYDFTKGLKIIIYLHKYDPFLELKPEDPINKSIEELLPHIHETLKNGWDYKIFKTSIYTQFRKIAL